MLANRERAIGSVFEMSHQSNFRNRANLQPNTTAQILAAVLPPLLRSSEPEKEKRVSATATIGTSGNGTVHVGGRENSG